jgi:hypothetical protein
MSKLQKVDLFDFYSCNILKINNSFSQKGLFVVDSYINQRLR